MSVSGNNNNRDQNYELFLECGFVTSREEFDSLNQIEYEQLLSCMVNDQYRDEFVDDFGIPDELLVQNETIEQKIASLKRPKAPEIVDVPLEEGNHLAAAFLEAREDPVRDIMYCSVPHLPK